MRTAVIALGLASANGAATQAADSPYLSPVAVAADADGGQVYVALGSGCGVAIVDPRAGKVTRTVALPGPANGLTVAPNGKTLYVACGVAEGRVCRIDPAVAKITATIAVGHTPTDVAASADGRWLYVANRFNDEVGVVDLGAGKQVDRVPVPREPVALALTADGKTLLVANHLPAGAANAGYAAAAVSVIDTTSRKVVATIKLPNGSTALRGLCLSPDGRFAYATHILARYQLPTTQLERGWMNTNALSVIDVAARKRVNTVLLDNVDRGAANPWGVGCSADGKWLVVAHAGTHELSVIDRPALHKRLDAAAKGERVTEVTGSADDVPNDLAFVVGIRQRVRLSGKGPRGLVVAGTTAYAAEYFSDSIAAVPLGAEARKPAPSIALHTLRALTLARLGEQHFNDASLCFQGWQSCATCHPDGRADGLNWDLLNDGIGNPKQTKSLLLAPRTPPAMVSGVRGDATAAVRAGIRHIQFAVRPEADAQAIDAYLASMQSVPSPHLVDGKLSEAARSGRALFDQAGCASCHPAPLYTDLKSYDVGTGSRREAGKAFDTPSLVEAWRTGPYLYDGRAATLKEVFTEHNASNQHGHTSGLTDKQLADLIAYLESL